MHDPVSTGVINPATADLKKQRAPDQRATRNVACEGKSDGRRPGMDRMARVPAMCRPQAGDDDFIAKPCIEMLLCIECGHCAGRCAQQAMVMADMRVRRDSTIGSDFDPLNAASSADFHPAGLGLTTKGSPGRQGDLKQQGCDQQPGNQAGELSADRHSPRFYHPATQLLRKRLLRRKAGRNQGKLLSKEAKAGQELLRSGGKQG